MFFLKKKIKTWFMNIFIKTCILHSEKFKVVRSWVAHGAICFYKKRASSFFETFYLGCVRYPHQNPLFGDDFGEFRELIYAPGGVTNYKCDKSGLIIGFDTCHAGMDNFSIDNEWMTQEVNKMAFSVAIIKTYMQRYRQADSKLRTMLVEQCRSEIEKLI